MLERARSQPGWPPRSRRRCSGSGASSPTTSRRRAATRVRSLDRRRCSSPRRTRGSARRSSGSSTSPRRAARSTTSAPTSSPISTRSRSGPPSIEAAMRIAGTAAGRKALGARDRRRRPPHGPPLHRRRDAGRGAGDARRACGRDGIAELGRPARRGDRDPRRGRPLRRALRSRRSRRSRGAAGRLAGAPVARARLGRAGPAGQPLGQGHGADAADAPAGARARPRRRGASGCGRCCAARATLGAHLHVDMESVDSLETTTDLVLGLLAEDEFADGPVGRRRRCRPTCATRPRSSTACSTGRARRGARSPLVVRLVKGAYWDHEVVEARQHGWSAPVFEDKADCDRNFEALTRGAARRAAARAREDRLAQPALGRPRDRLQPPHRRQRLRPRAPGAARARRRARRGAAHAERLRVRAYCPVGDLVAGMAYLVRRLLENSSNDSFLKRPRLGRRRSRSCSRRRETTDFANEPTPELRRAAARATGSPRRSPSSTGACRCASRS